MLVYYLLTKKEIVDIMSCKIIELNITNGILYTKMPQLDAETLVLRFQLSRNEKKDLIKLGSSIYRLNRGINLEGRKFKTILNDENQLEYINKTNFLYKEIKFNKEDINNICLKYLKGSNNKFTDGNNKETLLHEYELKKQLRVNKIKGMIYGITSESGMIRDYILKKFPVYYKELTKIIHIVEELRNNKMLDKELLKHFKNLERDLKKKVIKSVNDLDKKELVFKFNEKKQITFNNDFLTLTPLENQVFEIMINKIVNNEAKINEKQMLANVIIEIDKIVNSNNELNKFSNDMKLILDRVYEKNYDTNVIEIKSTLFKNLYATYIKYNNLSELHTFLNEKKIEKKFISLAIYGACKGFKYMPNSSTLNAQSDSLVYEVITSSLVNIENNFYDIEYNNIYTKNKICYFLNKISFHTDKIKNCNLQYAYIIIKSIKTHLQMSIKTKEYGDMIINFYPRANNMAKNIKYFDNKIERLKDIYKNFNYNKSLYFQYHFIKNKNIKMNTLQQEYYFSVLLKDISNIIN